MTRWVSSSLLKQPIDSAGSDSEGSVAVERLGGTKGEVTLAVTAQVVAGGALPSEDYVLTTSTLQFGDGDVKRLVKFDITDDSLLEGSEFISSPLQFPAQICLGRQWEIECHFSAS